MASGDAAPADANEGCVGPTSEEAGKASACAGCPNQSACASGEMRKPNPEAAAIKEKMKSIGRTVLVLSGKGGVGKSTFSAQLAFGLARAGKRVGLLDLDICGPSVPLMLGLSGREVHQSASGWSPVYVDVDSENDEDCELGVMSIGFLMPDPDSAVIWRGPRKNGLIQQFFTSVDWGELDYLVIDTPPGTSDEHISIVQLLKDSLEEDDGAVVVTTPQEVAMMDVRKELNFCKQTNIPVLGVVENMAQMRLPVNSLRFVSANGDEQTETALAALQEKYPELLNMDIALDVFPAAGGGPKGMAAKFGVPYLGSLPMDPNLQSAAETGKPVLEGSAMAPLKAIVDKIVASAKLTTSSGASQEDAAANGTGVISA
ncbi:Cytosolic Fe-S cluster assembly factor NBP35 [Hondaea fermentalgiana]|uniref:Cytosolic Fe-S cluster assembly factor NUBP1 homolog n=1 Tax=Hondaea fermentalgiana TaxID=2315210 RepID=A0A2R5GD51_9STRA|nr:Cytosolic Fe-S cluster assembly factor NBP35 [Hondaea fermentalgiana]|eukprot:GBG25714.1 Cytosolic Fe-S cluster assembly factor NBP35 [Hondaea fermentalgiana]